MVALNRVILAGNLTRDPELRYTPSGMAVAEFGLAVSEAYKNKAGELVESVCFVDIQVWGRTAENCGEYLSKGSPALIEGRLQFDQWQSKEGEKRSKLRVRADRVQFLGRPRKAEFGDAPEGGGGGKGSKREASAPANGDEPPSAAEDKEDDLPF